MNKKLYRVMVKLNKNGFEESAVEWEILKEFPKTYLIELKDKWGEYIQKNKKKEQIGVVGESAFNNSIGMIAYTAWCFESDIKDFTTVCKLKVIHTARTYEETFNKLLIHLI